MSYNLRDTHTHTHTHTNTQSHIHTHTHNHTYTYIHTITHTITHTHTHTHTYIYIHTHTHTHIDTYRCIAVFQRRGIVPILSPLPRTVDGINHNLIARLPRSIVPAFEDHFLINVICVLSETVLGHTAIQTHADTNAHILVLGLKNYFSSSH